jgi:hypothetical protein
VRDRSRARLEVDSTVARYALKIEVVVIGDLFVVILVGLDDFSMPPTRGEACGDSDQTTSEPLALRLHVGLLPCECADCVAHVVNGGRLAGSNSTVNADPRLQYKPIAALHIYDRECHLYRQFIIALPSTRGTWRANTGGRHVPPRGHRFTLDGCRRALILNASDEALT